MEDDIDMPAGGLNDEMMDDFPGENPVIKVGEEKEIGKQGLMKKLLKEGEGWDTPEVGDEVEGEIFMLAFLRSIFVALGFLISTMTMCLQYIIPGLSLTERSLIPAGTVELLLSSS